MLSRLRTRPRGSRGHRQYGRPTHAVCRSDHREASCRTEPLSAHKEPPSTKRSEGNRSNPVTSAHDYVDPPASYLQIEPTVSVRMEGSSSPPNGSRLSCGRKAHGRKAVERERKRVA